MTLNDLSQYTFKTLRHDMAPRVKHEVEFALPSMPMVEACRADDFDFFRPAIAAGRLTVPQMQHACLRYLLGKTSSGHPIFWMIDDMFMPQDARIARPAAADTWLSLLLKAREPLIGCWRPVHCLFGLHLAQSEVSKPVCVVESEASAVVLSALFPESLWMAYVSVPHLTVDLFAPLQGRTVIVYPRTDPAQDTYIFFLDLAADIRRAYPDIYITVDPVLENNATDEQKQRKIDLLDFLTDPP